jgi:hypothetical protein
MSVAAWLEHDAALSAERAGLQVPQVAAYCAGLAVQPLDRVDVIVVFRNYYHVCGAAGVPDLTELLGDVWQGHRRVRSTGEERIRKILEESPSDLIEVWSLHQRESLHQPVRDVAFEQFDNDEAQRVTLTSRPPLHTDPEIVWNVTQ